MNSPSDPFEYVTPPEELQRMLTLMQAASNQFYRAAFTIGCHPWIEWTGLLNEYIGVCRAAVKQGIDFNNTSKHADGALPMQLFQACYLGEKLGCIFKGTFARKPELMQAFMQGFSAP